MGSQGGGQQSHSQPLSRQSSLYGLTLDQVQTHFGDLGKPLTSMNLDELVRNVLCSESHISTGVDVQVGTAETPQVGGVQRQGSLTMDGVLSKKTVDEVWRDIQRGQLANNNNYEEKKTQDRQPTFGEMTLEDFLVKAGVVAEAPDMVEMAEDPQGVCKVDSVLGVHPIPGSQSHPPQGHHWLHYPCQQQPQSQPPNVMDTYVPPPPPLSQALSVAPGPLLEAPYPEILMPISSSSLTTTLSDAQTPGRKRTAPIDVADKSVERRQKRMIKNRESAARSRARKQAGLLFFFSCLPCTTFSSLS